MCQYANVPITMRHDSAANWHIGILAHWHIGTLLNWQFIKINKYEE